MQTSRLLVLLLAVALSTGCTPESVPAADSCETVADGLCDEPTTCAFGTDSEDCEAACADDPNDPTLAGACAHRLATWQAPERSGTRSSGGAGGKVGTWDGEVQVRGARTSDVIDRQYRVYVPQTVDPDVPVPVIFALGGFTVHMYVMTDYTELNRTADLGGFIVVYGNPELREWGGQYGWVYSWYSYEQAFQGSWPDNPDLAYLEAVLGEVSALYNIDLNRVVLSGHSRGAALSLIAAHERPDLYTGFIWQAGFFTNNDYDDRMRELDLDRLPTAFLVHGDADPDVPVSSSDALEDYYLSVGAVEGEDYTYYRLPDVRHEWQPQYNQQVMDFQIGRPLEVAP